MAEVSLNLISTRLFDSCEVGKIRMKRSYPYLFSCKKDKEKGETNEIDKQNFDIDESRVAQNGKNRVLR